MTKSNASKSKLLTAEQIDAAEDIGVDVYFVEEWKGSVRLVGLTAAERDAFTSSVSEGKGRDKDFSLINIRAKFVAKHMRGEDGRQLMKPESLGKKSSAVLERLYDRCAELSGMTPEHMRELAKNLPEAQSEDSPTV